jgi:hypothetical protein
VPSVAAGGEIGRERGDALEEVLGSGTEIEDHRLLGLSAARRRLGKSAPGGGLFRVLHLVFGISPGPGQVCRS